MKIADNWKSAPLLGVYQRQYAIINVDKQKLAQKIADFSH